jgi:hypothetical protein
MGIYTIQFERTWTETDTLERVIEADSEAEAMEKAADMASEFDSDCPDDVVSSKGGAAGDWGWVDVEETPDATVDDDDAEPPAVPADWPVQPIPRDEALKRAEEGECIATCEECERSWDDSVATSMTPAPAGRCPFENFH